MATLGSDKLTGIENVDGNDSVVSRRYVETVVPSVGGATKSYLKAEGQSYSTWSMRTLTTSPDSPGERPSYNCKGGFLYSEKDDILLAAYHYTTNRENYVSASTDAIHWSLRTLPIATSGTKYPVQSLNYANGLYFADATYNLSVSTDTIHWIARTSVASYTSTPLSGSGSTHMIYGYSGTEESYIYYWASFAAAITSTDTIHWTLRTKPGGGSSTYDNRDALYKDGYFLAAGGSSSNYMITASTDAIVWQFRTFGATPVSGGLYYIQYLDGISKYCALGYNHYGLSTDAIHWDTYDNLNGAGQLTPLVFDNDFKSKKYYTCKLGSNSTYDDLYITTDAIHWTTQDGVLYNSSTDYPTAFYAIHKKPGGGFVRPGDRTLYYTSEIEKKSFASETSLQSPKGTAFLTFDRYYSGQTRNLYLPSGVTSILVEWARGAQCGYRGTPGSSSGTSYRSSPLYKTIIKVDPSNDNLRFSYKVGDTNYSNGAYGATFKYSDSNSWKDVGNLVYQQTSYSSPYSSALGLTSDGQEAYVLGYNSGRLVSSVGSITDWSARTCAIGSNIYAAHAYNGTFFIANSSGHTASSTDTIHWTLRTIPSGSNVYEIKDWNGLWRIFYGTSYAVSTDAIHWTLRTVGVSSFAIYSGAYDSSTGTTILVGGSSRKIASSTDDIHWTQRTVATSYSSSATYRSALSNNNGQFVVAGNYGDTQKSTDGIVWTYIDWVSDLGFSYDGRSDNQSGVYHSYDPSEYFDGKFYFSMYDYPTYYGRHYTVVSSTDAIHWKHDNIGDNHTNIIYDISYSDALKTTLTAFPPGSNNGNAATSWTLYDSASAALFSTSMDYNNDGLYSYYDFGVESGYNSGETVSGVSGVSDGRDSGTTQYTNVNYAKSTHTGFFTTSGGSGASKVGDGGSVSKKYYGSTQTVSGGSKNLSTFNLTVTNSGSSNYVISGTDETTTHSSASNPTITVKSGNVVIFDVNASGHPFWIKTDESTGTDNRVPTYIVKNNGAETDKVIFNTVGLNAGTYYYNCQYHSSMRGTINVTAATSSFDGSDGTSNAFSGNRFGMGGGGGAAFEQAPNFWTRFGQSEGFPDSNVFGYTNGYDRFAYDSHYNFWVYTAYNNAGGGFAISTDVIHWVLRTVGNSTAASYGYFATNGSGEYILQGNNSLAASTDTIHWALRTTGTTDRLARWAVGNGYIMGASTEFAAAAMSSTDTIHWGRRTVSTRYGYYTYGLGFAGGLFHVSDGQGYYSYNVSTDSIHWVLRTSQVRFAQDDAVKYGSYQGTNVYFAPYQGGADYVYSTDTIHWLVSDKISISAAGATAGASSAFATDGSGNWYYANRNGDSPDGNFSLFRAFYEPGGDEIYATGNGGDGGLGCSGGGGATTAQFGGIGGLGGQGYIQLSWW